MSLSEILSEHKIWLETAGKNGKKADLLEADLCGADLRKANLGGADLGGADLCGADLCEADLHGANLCGVELLEADLREADLREADLSGADLYRAKLSGADLYRAKLSGANLSGADLSGAKNIFNINNIGSRNDNTFFIKYKNIIMVKCGCFWGNIAEFSEKIIQTHGDNEHAQIYFLSIEIAKLKLK